VNFLKAFGYFWWDLIIGDDWRIAAYVVTSLALATGLMLAGAPDLAVGLVALALVMGSFAFFVRREAR
jgi:hypothetical protein